MYYYNCKLLGLRGRNEHRDLDSRQFGFGEDEQGNYLEFFRHSSKNFPGGIRARNIEPKSVRHYSSHNGEVRCIERLYANLTRMRQAAGLNGHFTSHFGKH